MPVSAAWLKPGNTPERRISAPAFHLSKRGWPYRILMKKSVLSATGKRPWMSFSHTVVRLKDFYENRVVRWESWQKSLEKFTGFQSEIEEDPEAAAGLSRLRHVLEMQSPWDDLDCMDDLIARIKPVYDRIRDERFTLLQHDTLLQINRMIETISELLENVHARTRSETWRWLNCRKSRRPLRSTGPAVSFPNSGKLPKKPLKRHRILCFPRADSAADYPSNSKSFSPLQKRPFLLS